VASSIVFRIFFLNLFHLAGHWRVPIKESTRIEDALAEK